MKTDGAAAAAAPLAGRRILVGISGSIAAVKLPLLVSALVQQGAEVRCVLTPSAARLVSPQSLACLSRTPCHLEADQWSHREPRPLHIALAEWAELVLVAPLSASSLARWVHGLADTLLASTLMACEAPVLAAAAMNTSMWGSTAVQRNWEVLARFPQVLPLAPEAGLLACDRQGQGRMADPDLLLLALESLALVGPRQDWRDRRLLVSAGPTREPLDPARCLTNPSTGRMGVLLAQAARLRGARVELVHGPLTLPPAWLEGIARTPVQTAAEMEAALLELQPQPMPWPWRPRWPITAGPGPRPGSWRRVSSKRPWARAGRPCPICWPSWCAGAPTGSAFWVSRPSPARCCPRPAPSWRARAVISSSPTRSTVRVQASAASPMGAGCWAPAIRCRSFPWRPSWRSPTSCSRRCIPQPLSGLRRRGADPARRPRPAAADP